MQRTCKPTYFFIPQLSEAPSFKRNSPQTKVREENPLQVSNRATFLKFRCLSLVKTGPSVVFLDPPEKVEARVGEQARLKCEFKSSSLPVACCWIYNKRKVKLLQADVI